MRLFGYSTLAEKARSAAFGAVLAGAVAMTQPQTRVQMVGPSGVAQDAGASARIGWLRSRAVPIRTDDPQDEDFRDLAPLKQTLAGVRVLGLGEQTHGTREFLRMKHRLFEFLVREMGFRTVALEASQGQCEAIDDYVMGRRSDRDAVLAGQGFWMWNTEEMSALLDWMRAYNARVPPRQHIRFVGVDFQYRTRSQTVVADYVRRVAPERVAAVLDLFARTPEYFPIFLSADWDAVNRAQQQIADTRREYLELLGFFTLSRLDLTRRTGEQDYDEAIRHAWLLAQYAHFHSPTPSRDVLMAENLIRVADPDASGGGVVFWAHNGHVQDSVPPAGGATGGTAGHHLRQVYKSAYFALGFAAGHGGFQAYDTGTKPTRLTEFAMPPAEPGTIDWDLARVGPERYLVDLRGQAAAPIAAWLSSPQKLRSYGTIFNAKAPFAFTTVLQPGFDGLLFVALSTRARPK